MDLSALEVEGIAFLRNVGNKPCFVNLILPLLKHYEEPGVVKFVFALCRLQCVCLLCYSLCEAVVGGGLLPPPDRW